MHFDALFSAIPQPVSAQSPGFHRLLVYMENQQVYIFGQENVYAKLFSQTDASIKQTIRCTILLRPYLTSCVPCASIVQVNMKSWKRSNYL